MRYMSYKAFVAWVFGKAYGHKKRLVLPACVVNAVRETYPNRTTEKAVGFLHPLYSSDDEPNSNDSDIAE